MTANQIAYARHQEDKRHNLALESQGQEELKYKKGTSDAALMQAEVAKIRAVEEGRHNLISEQISSKIASESERHNVEMESAQKGALAESIRHNMFGEELSAKSATSLIKLQDRQGVAVLQQAQASLSQAAAAHISAAAAQEQARVAGVNAATRQSELAETIQHNAITRNEVARHNEAMEINDSVKAGAATSQAESAAKQAQAAAVRSGVDFANGAMDALPTSGLGSSILGIVRGMIK